MPTIKNAQMSLYFDFNKIIKGPATSLHSPVLSQKHVEMFLIQHTTISPNYILVVLRIQKKYGQV